MSEVHFDKACSSCRYYNRNDETCHRLPPQFLAGDGMPMRGRWPTVSVLDWCGEYASVGPMTPKHSKNHDRVGAP